MSLLDRLSKGDRRGVCGVDEAVRHVLAEPALLAELIDGMEHDDPLVRMRSADAVEKATATHPDWLQPYKRAILTKIARSRQQEVRWHVAQLISRLTSTATLTAAERRRARDILLVYLDDKSSIVRVFSMQALADLAGRDATMRAEVVPLLERLTATRTPAMRSRGKKLLAKLTA